MFSVAHSANFALFLAISTHKGPVLLDILLCALFAKGLPTEMAAIIPGKRSLILDTLRAHDLRIYHD